MKRSLLYVLTAKAIPVPPGCSGVLHLHLTLRAGAKGTGRLIATNTCLATAQDYRAAVWEIAADVKRRHGILPAWILNHGPFSVLREEN